MLTTVHPTLNDYVLSMLYDITCSRTILKKKELLKEAVVISIKHIQKLRECQQFVY